MAGYSINVASRGHDQAIRLSENEDGADSHDERKTERERSCPDRDLHRSKWSEGCTEERTGGPLLFRIVMLWFYNDIYR